MPCHFCRVLSNLVLFCIGSSRFVSSYDCFVLSCLLALFLYFVLLSCIVLYCLLSFNCLVLTVLTFDCPGFCLSCLLLVLSFDCPVNVFIFVQDEGTISTRDTESFSDVNCWKCNRGTESFSDVNCWKCNRPKM